jgi:GT2 family glycosyltransferase
MKAIRVIPTILTGLLSRQDMKEIGICIVTRGSKEKVVACLKSLFEQTQTLEIDVVVVDNDSRDGTVEEIQSQFPKIHLIGNNKNLGYSKAVNQGLKILNARYLVLLNPDAIVLNQALDRLVKFMDENSEVGICAPKVLNQDGTVQYQSRRGEPRPWNVFSYFLGLSKLFPKDPRFSGYLLTYLDDNTVNEVDAVSGSCMLIRNEVVTEIGYLDERYFAYQEDTDYCIHARQAGWKVCYVPTAEVLHYGGRGGSNINPYFGVYHWHRSYYLYYRKNLAKDYPFWFHPLYYFGMLVKFVFNVVGLFFSRDKTVGTPKP